MINWKIYYEFDFYSEMVILIFPELIIDFSKFECKNPKKKNKKKIA